MKLWIDGDGCPVVQHAIDIAKRNGLAVTVVKNHAVQVKEGYAEVITVDVSRDAADFYIVNHMSAGDIVITQDYGLSAMVLSKRGYCMNQNGRQVTQENIDLILEQRHNNRVERQKNKKYTKFKKRRPEDDDAFGGALMVLLEKLL